MGSLRVTVGKETSEEDVEAFLNVLLVLLKRHAGLARGVFMNANLPTVAVAMSGGVDSSVAAALLVEQGYSVIGLMLRLWSEPGKESQNKCCTPDAMAQARRSCGHLGIPFYQLTLSKYLRIRLLITF
jgi:asparagine synthetase B (glutamine-hydrolysing)